MKEIDYKEISIETRRRENPYYIVEEKEERFIAVAGRGQKPTGGYDINVEKVVQKGNKIIITLRSFDPDPDEFVNQIITYPRVAISIEKNKLDIKDDLIFIFENSAGDFLAEKNP